MSHRNSFMTLDAVACRALRLVLAMTLLVEEQHPVVAYSLSPRNRDGVEKTVMDRGVDLTCSGRNLGRGALVAFDPVGL
jgi:hypothetical protein